MVDILAVFDYFVAKLGLYKPNARDRAALLQQTEWYLHQVKALRNAIKDSNLILIDCLLHKRAPDCVAELRIIRPRSFWSSATDGYSLTDEELKVIDAALDWYDIRIYTNDHLAEIQKKSELANRLKLASLVLPAAPVDTPVEINKPTALVCPSALVRQGESMHWTLNAPYTLDDIVTASLYLDSLGQEAYLHTENQSFINPQTVADCYQHFLSAIAKNNITQTGKDAISLLCLLGTLDDVEASASLLLSYGLKTHQIHSDAFFTAAMDLLIEGRDEEEDKSCGGEHAQKMQAWRVKILAALRDALNARLNVAIVK